MSSKAQAPLPPLPSWITVLRDANCSMLVVIKNRTDNSLFRTNFKLPAGIWREWPPETIEPHAEVIFGSESYGLLTGTTGTVEYQMSEGQEPFVFSWDIPFFGENTIDYTCAPSFRIGKEEQLSSKSATAVFSIHDPFEGDYRNNVTKTQLVTRSPVVYETWKLELKNAARSVLITLNNTTRYTLILKKSHVRHGIWRLPPPQEVKPDSDPIDFGAESHGITGSAGEIVYEIIDETQPERQFGDISFVWSIPMIGNNSFSSNVFAVAPQVDGEHSVVSLQFTSDETFLLEVSETGTGNTNTSGIGITTATTTTPSNSDSVSKFAKTSYGFDGDGTQSDPEVDAHV